MLTIDQRIAISTMCEIAPIIASVSDPTAVLAATFCSAKEMVKNGDTEMALALLEEYPDFGIGEKIEENSDTIANALIKALGLAED